MSSELLRTTVGEIKKVFLDFHKERDYKIFKPAPLISSDQTLLFINSTIAPFKSYFTDKLLQPKNYASIQGCLRVGGASEIEMVGANPYYFTFFEMLGSGTFNVTHEKIVRYLLDLLSVFGIEKEQLYFTVPNDKRFQRALRENKINEERIFRLLENKTFWQEWHFGTPGPVGHGLTVIFSRSQNKVSSIEELASDQDHYVELLNLIHVHSLQLASGKLVPLPNPGFDLGIGVERLAAVLQNCNCYQIDNISPLVWTVKDFFQRQGIKIDDTTARTCADHFRAVYVLLSEGVVPSNKKHGYVLRKLIRRFLEMVWLSAKEPLPVEELVKTLAVVFEKQDLPTGIKQCSNLSKEIHKEEEAFLKVLQRAERIIEKHPEFSVQKLHETYGISEAILKLISPAKKNHLKEANQ